MEVMELNRRASNNGLMKPKYLRINTKDLIIPEHAQRRFVQKHGDRLAKVFSIEKFHPLDVSFRNGKYYVIDGQNRLYAIKKIKGGDCTVLCYVHYGMTELDEAEFFLNQSKDVSPIPVADRQNVRFMNGDPEIIEMVRGATVAGLLVDFSTKKANGRIIALSTLETIHKSMSYEAYVSMLTTLNEAWLGNSDSLSREILLGLGLFFNTYYGQFKPNLLAKNLSNVSPIAIIAEGRTNIKSRTGNTALSAGRPYARVILRIWNNMKRSNRLEDNL